MRDKHIRVAEDNQLLKTIYATVEEELRPNDGMAALLIWLKLLVYACAVGLAYAGILLIADLFGFLACFVAYGFVLLLLAFNFAHDLSHNTVFRKKGPNNFFYTLIYTLAGAHAEAWKLRHVHSHHYAPNVEHYDSDLSISSLIRVIPGSRHIWYHRFQHLYAPLAYTTYSLFWVFIKDFVLLFSKDGMPKNKGLTYHLSFWLQKSIYIGYLIVVPLLFSQQSWTIVLCGFLLMHLMQSLFLLFTFFMTHHVEGTDYPTVDAEGYINSSWVMNQIKSSNDMHPFSPMANFILGGFNNHIAHHLFPHIHHVHYPALNRILYRLLNERGIHPNQTSYFGGIVAHLRLLKRMGKPES